MDIVNLDHLSSVYDNNRSKRFLKRRTEEASIAGGLSITQGYAPSSMAPPIGPQTFNRPDSLPPSMPSSTGNFWDYFCHGNSHCPILDWDSFTYLASEANAPEVMALAGRKQVNGGLFSFGYASIRT